MGDGKKVCIRMWVRKFGFYRFVPGDPKKGQLAHDVHARIIYDTHIIGGASARTPEYAYRRDRIDKCMISSWTAPLLLFALPLLPPPPALDIRQGYPPRTETEIVRDRQTQRK